MKTLSAASSRCPLLFAILILL
ncbi:MAG: hypothetical protein RLZZ265_2828, partial [Verrucomicrobiota bacterium]